MAPKKAVLKKPAAVAQKVEEEEEAEDEEDDEGEEDEEDEEDEAEPEPVRGKDRKDPRTSVASSPPRGASAAAAASTASSGAAAVARRSPTKLSPQKRPWEATVAGSTAVAVAPGTLTVSYASEGDSSSQVCEGLVRLRRECKLCDAAVVAGGSAQIGVHRIVLAANSDALDERLRISSTLDLGSTSHEAADFLVRWLYGEVNAVNYWPSTTNVNEEVLRLSSEFALPKLSELCALRLAVGVNVRNVVARIRLCEEFGIPALRAALVQTLIEDKEALAVVSQDAETLAHPALMRELLAAIALKAQGL